jgi:hypothetical protein
MIRTERNSGNGRSTEDHSQLRSPIERERLPGRHHLKSQLESYHQNRCLRTRLNGTIAPQNVPKIRQFLLRWSSHRPPIYCAQNQNLKISISLNKCPLPDHGYPSPPQSAVSSPLSRFTHSLPHHYLPRVPRQ